MVIKSTPIPKKILSQDGLLEEIYLLRLHLNEMSKDIECLSHPKIVEVSQLLDEKLNNYNQMAYES